MSDLDFEGLVRRVSIGDMLARRSDYEGLDIWQRLALQEAERQALWSMTYEERVLAHRRGEMTAYQRSCWLDAWHEVPKVNDLPEWIGLKMADLDPD